MMKCKVKHVKSTDLEEYFALPKKDREKWGFWYLKPMALPMNNFFDDNEKGGWKEFSKRIRSEYPIQGWLREWFFDFDNPVYSFISVKRTKTRDLWYRLKCFFKPHHPIIRKALPRTWSDISSLLVDVNLAMIEQFYQEAEGGNVDWSSTDHHKVFHEELGRAHKYITKVRPALQEKLPAAYESARKKGKLPYEEQYSRVILIEKLIDNLDTKYIFWAVKNRDFFWT